jgi:aryl-alcohol dehydrogenase-like predicted oxidoreductase
MNTCKIPKTVLAVSRLGFGSVRLIGWDKEPNRKAHVTKAADLIHTAYDQGVTLFDHADVYPFGYSGAVIESVLSSALSLLHSIISMSCVATPGSLLRSAHVASSVSREAGASLPPGCCAGQARSSPAEYECRNNSTMDACQHVRAALAA